MELNKKLMKECIKKQIKLMFNAVNSVQLIVKAIFVF